MNVIEMTGDSWEGIEQKETILQNPSWVDIDAAIRRLDGRKYTIVSLKGQGESHMVIGGGMHDRYIVYVTLDNEKFYNLVSDRRLKGTVLLFIGGQEGEYPAETVIDIVLVLKAAETFVEHGAIDTSLQWNA